MHRLPPAAEPVQVRTGIASDDDTCDGTWSAAAELNPGGPWRKPGWLTLRGSPAVIHKFLLTCRYRLGVRTRGSQPRDRGSNPRTGTILRARTDAERASDGNPSFAYDSGEGVPTLARREFC